MIEKSDNPTVKIVIAIIGAVGLIGVALIGYSATIKSTMLPIEATKKAEDVHTAVALQTQLAWTPTVPYSSTATVPSLTETFTPAPSLQAFDLAIAEFAFCEIQDIDPATKYSETKICTVSRTTFLQGTTAINVSWKYKGNYLGTYSRLWYTNGVISTLPTRSGSNKQWKSDGEIDSTSVTYLAGLEPGVYKVEFRLDSNNQLIFEASFIVQ